MMFKNTHLLTYFFSVIFLLSLDCASGQSLLSIGEEEGDEYLIDPTQIEEGPDGNIYVFDRSDAHIKVYSPEGKYLRRIGGKGLLTKTCYSSYQ